MRDPRVTDQRFPAVEPPLGGNGVPIGQLVAAGAIWVGDRYDLGSTVGRGQVSVRQAAVTPPRLPQCSPALSCGLPRKTQSAPALRRRHTYGLCDAELTSRGR
jgi:hypothetical protein